MTRVLIHVRHVHKHALTNGTECLKASLLRQCESRRKYRTVAATVFFFCTWIQNASPAHIRPWNLIGVRDFFLSLCGPISFLRLSLRRYHLVYLFAVITFRGRLGRVGRHKACLGGFRGRHYQKFTARKAI